MMRSVATTALRSARRPGMAMAPKDMAIRNLNLHEYQSKTLMDKYNVLTQKGQECRNAEEATKVCEWIKEGNPAGELIVKAQIHAGGRGKGRFVNSPDLGGVKICTEVEEAVAHVPNMIGDTLVTHQTGPEGQECGIVLINEGLDIMSETYVWRGGRRGGEGAARRKKKKGGGRRGMGERELRERAARESCERELR